MPSDALFDQVMGAGLSDWYASLEADRVTAANTANQRKALAGVGAGLLGLGVFAVTLDPVLAGFVGFGLFGVAWAWADAPVQALKRRIKEEANSALAAALGASYQQETSPSADYRTAEAFGLVPRNPDEADYADSWEGPFGGLDLSLHEAHLQEWQGSGKHRRLVTVFRGVVMGYRFARAFHGVTLLRREGFRLRLFGGSKETVGGVELEPVRMVDPGFERVFDVLGTDQVEARYLIHPAFCERLVDLETAFHGKNIRLVFAEGRVVVVVETRDLFESGGMDAAGDEARLRETISQIGSLLELAQSLNERAR